MSYRNQYSGSPWQQGGPPFGVSGYGQSYGGYGLSDQYAMMNSGYSRNQGGYGSMYGSSGMSQMRSIGYGGPSPSRHYINDRMGGRQGSRGQMQRKRLPQRSPAGGPRSKRPNLDSDSRRNRSKPRRRRDSRGGSKGRREHSEDEKGDEPYNPAEPTDDASDINYDDYESWKSSSDDENDNKEGVTQNGEQPAIDGEEAKEKSDKTDELDKSKDTKKPLVCHVCKIICSNPERFRKHMNSRTHKAKMETLLALQREKKQVLEASMKASQQVENRDSQKKGSRKSGNWCTVCECSFSGNFLAHRRTKEHRFLFQRKRDKKYPKCRPCRVGFSSSEEYKEHCKKEDHKLKSAEFHYLKNLASGSDDDEAAIEPVKPEVALEFEKYYVPPKEDPIDFMLARLLSYGDAKTSMDDDSKTDVEMKENTDAKEEVKEEDKENADQTKTESEETCDEKKEKKDDAKSEKKPAKPKEPKAIGQSFVVSVQGYYCKLCHKFFKDVTVAKVKHCRSIMHNGAFKKAMEEAMEQEEERQKLADEQEKLEREAAEAARLAAEIAAVEKAAKEAAKREAAEKKAAQKSKDVEMKDTDDGNVDVKESADDDKVANGEKEEMEVTTEADQQEIEAKEATKPDTAPAPTSAVEEKPTETAQSDSQGDEEVEEEPEKKEEPTSSPATRRGRGRGRGQSRGKGKRR